MRFHQTSLVLRSSLLLVFSLTAGQFVVSCGSDGRDFGDSSGNGGDAGDTGNDDGGKSSGGSTSGGTADGGKPGAGATSSAAGRDSGESGAGGGSNEPEVICVLNDGEIVAGCRPAEDTIFVDAGAADGGTGTRLKPAKTLAAALQLAKLRSISQLALCEGTYAEPLSVDQASAVRLVAGGFSCDTWEYSEERRSLVRPAEPGYALVVDVPEEQVAFLSVAFESLDAVNPGDSSVAAFVRGSSAVRFERVSFTAGIGRPGAKGATVNYVVGNAATNWPSAVASPGTSTSGGAAVTVTCPGSNLKSVGGSGGTSRDTSVSPTREQVDATAGTPSGGTAGTSTLVYNSPSSCTGGGSVSTAAKAGDDGTGAKQLGALSATGWKPQGGVAGKVGLAGGGGGGGGFLANCGASAGGAGCSTFSNGGGGGPGGCGGAGGAAGLGGGSSVALMSFQSAITIVGGSFTAANGGDGGAGDAGQVGQAGKSGGARWLASGQTSGCSGGSGGNGGPGGGGGGGSGGSSLGVLWSGTAPVLEADPTFSLGAAGDGGKGAGSNNSGDPGAARNLQAL